MVYLFVPNILLIKKQTNKRGMPKATVNSQTENVTPQYTRPCENKHSLSTPELSKKNLHKSENKRRAATELQMSLHKKGAAQLVDISLILVIPQMS